MNIYLIQFGTNALQFTLKPRTVNYKSPNGVNHNVNKKTLLGVAVKAVK